MPSSFAPELRGWVVAYVSGRASLREFQEWFVPRSWMLDWAEDPDQARVAARIELLLAEWSNGHWSEDDLKDRLAQFAISVRVESPVLQKLGSSVVGLQPERPTRYIGDRPFSAMPRILVSQAGQ